MDHKAKHSTESPQGKPHKGEFATVPQLKYITGLCQEWQCTADGAIRHFAEYAGAKDLHPKTHLAQLRKLASTGESFASGTVSKYLASLLIKCLLRCRSWTPGDAEAYPNHPPPPPKDAAP